MGYAIPSADGKSIEVECLATYLSVVDYEILETHRRLEYNSVPANSFPFP